VRQGEVVDDSWVDRCRVGCDLAGSGSEPHRARKEGPRGNTVATLREQDVDDLTGLINRPVELGAAAGHLDIGLIDEPAISGSRAGMASDVDELRRECVHPAVDRLMTDSDTTLGQQLRHVAVGQCL